MVVLASAQSTWSHLCSRLPSLAQRYGLSAAIAAAGLTRAVVAPALDWRSRQAGGSLRRRHGCRPASPSSSGSSTPSCSPAWAASPTRPRGGGVGGRRVRMPRCVHDGARNAWSRRSARFAAHTRRPFGVDLLTAMPGGLEHQVGLLIEEGASVFVAGLGVPAGVVSLCHEAGVLVVNMCGKVEHARRAVQAGCDLVVAQGTEAGGHTGQVATMPLVPQIVDAVGASVPVVAAGGIFDGRGSRGGARARRRRGVGRHPLHRDARGAGGARLQGRRCSAASEDATVVSRAYSGKTMRVIAQFLHGAISTSIRGARAFPAQLGRSMADGAFHLGAGPDQDGVDPGPRVLPGRPGDRGDRGARTRRRARQAVRRRGGDRIGPSRAERGRSVTARTTREGG